MRWYLTIPFALGIFLSPELGEAWRWLLGLLILGMLTMWMSYRMHHGIMAVFLLNSFLLGGVYGHLRLQMGGGEKEMLNSQTVQRIEDTLARSHLSEEHKAVLNAMLLGDRNGLSKDQKSLFRNSGVQHLLALSGMHLSILLALLGFLLVPVVRFGRWRWPAFFLVVFLMWFYAYMVGMPKSLLRAVLMTSLFLLGKFSLRPTKGYDILATAVLFMLLVDPMCAFDIGAQLSVAALVGLTVFFPTLDGVVPFVSMKNEGKWFALLRKIRQFLRFCFVSFSAWLFTLPLVLFYFHSVQLWQPLVSIVLIPFTSIVLYGGVAVILLGSFGCFTLQAHLSEVLDKMMDMQDGILSSFASLPMSNVYVPDVSWGHVVLLYLLFAELWVMLRYRSTRILLMSSITCLLTVFMFALL